MDGKISPRQLLLLDAAAAFALLVCAFLFSLTYSPLQGDCGMDREVFRYAGMVIANGGAPYLDVFDHKPPLIYFFYALVHRWDPLGHWVLETILLAGAAVVLYALARRRRWPLPVIYPLYFMALLRTQEIVASTGLTRSYSATFTVAAAAVALLEPAFAPWLLGLLFAVCFFLQQNDAMPLGLLVLFFLLKRRHYVRDLLEMAAGSLLVTGALFLWLAHKGAFQAFVNQAFLFNTRLYVDDHVRGLAWLGFFWGRLRHAVNDFGFKNWFTVVAVLYAFLPRKAYWNLRELPFSALTWVALGLVAELFFMNISGVLYNTYFLGFIPWVVLFTGELFRVYGENTASLLPRRYVYFLLLAALFVLPNSTIGRTLQRSLPLGKALVKANELPICGAEMTKFAQEVAGQKGQFYPFGEVPFLSLNRHFNIVAPAIWVSTHYWNQIPKERFDGDRREFQKILDGLEGYKTKYVYMAFTPEKPPFLDADLNERWFRYFYAHYAPAEGALWRRKAGP